MQPLGWLKSKFVARVASLSYLTVTRHMEIIVHYYILILGLVLILSLPETLILNRTNTTNYSYKKYSYNSFIVVFL